MSKKKAASNEVEKMEQGRLIIDSKKGYFRMYRSLMDDSMLKRPECLMLFVYLVSKATRKEITIMAGPTAVKLQRGQCFVSLDNLSGIFGCNKDRIRRRMEVTRKWHAIDTEVTRWGTIVTIRNYDEFSPPDQITSHGSDTETARKWHGSDTETARKPPGRQSPPPHTPPPLKNENREQRTETLRGPEDPPRHAGAENQAGQSEMALSGGSAQTPVQSSAPEGSKPKKPGAELQDWALGLVFEYNAIAKDLNLDPAVLVNPKHAGMMGRAIKSVKNAIHAISPDNPRLGAIKLQEVLNTLASEYSAGHSKTAPTLNLAVSEGCWKRVLADIPGWYWTERDEEFPKTGVDYRESAWNTQNSAGQTPEPSEPEEPEPAPKPERSSEGQELHRGQAGVAMTPELERAIAETQRQREVAYRGQEQGSCETEFRPSWLDDGPEDVQSEMAFE